MASENLWQFLKVKTLIHTKRWKRFQQNINNPKSIAKTRKKSDWQASQPTRTSKKGKEIREPLYFTKECKLKIVMTTTDTYNNSIYL